MKYLGWFLILCAFAYLVGWLIAKALQASL